MHRHSVTKEILAVALLVVVLVLAAMVLCGCAAAGRDQKGIEVSPQVQAEFAAKIAAEIGVKIADEIKVALEASFESTTETTGGDQAGPVVSGEGHRVTSFNFTSLASQGGISTLVLAAYILVYRPMVRKRREEWVACIVRKMMRPLP